ncbi:recombinase family protein [[Actinomadura] parvosata]|uniref:recombinase family protein n=1 Tax=[Actinomadura] parvosata TaxID=1955412 RepID=UPI00406CC0B6
MSPTATKGLEALIYDRVSKDRRRNHLSVASQEAKNKAACEEQEWVVGEVYEDNDLSASRFARKPRPDWDRLQADLEAGRGDVLVMWESSRGDRKPIEWLTFLELCRSRGMLIHITSHERTYDMRVPRDWKTLAEDGVGNAYESELISQRNRRVTERQAGLGKPHGKLLYGYRREYDRATGELLRQVIDDRPRAAIAAGCMAASTGPLAIEWFTAPDIVRECARRVVEGNTPYEIAQDLNRRGIPTPRRSFRGWQPEQVKDQVTNPGYVGRRLHRGRDVGEAKWKAILKEDTFDACVAKLNDPSRKNQRDTTIKHLLSGIATCGVCSAPMRVVKNRGALAYGCYRKTPQAGSAFHVSRLQRRLEEWVVDVVVHHLAREDAASIWAADDEADAEARALEEEAAAEQARLNTFYDQAAEGDLTPDGLKRIVAKLQPKIDRLQTRARSLRRSRLPLVDDLVDPDPEVVRARWENLTMVQKREVLRALTDRIEVLPAGRGRTNYNDWEFTRIVWRGQSSPEHAGVDDGQLAEVDV